MNPGDPPMESDRALEIAQDSLRVRIGLALDRRAGQTSIREMDQWQEAIAEVQRVRDRLQALEDNGIRLL